jgi:UDP-N-acetylglucosamine:LPS N-acetylglucosamine transferase
MILSAGVGGGHHAAADALHRELLRDAPGARVSVLNGMGERRGCLRFLSERLVRWQLTRFPRAYSVSYAAFVRSRAGRYLTLRVIHLGTRARLGALIASEQPDVVVSTYPGVTAALGVMRQRRTVGVPVCAMITDIAGLHFWAHAGIDLHIASYRESLQEIAAVSDGAAAQVGSPPIGIAHLRRRDRRATRSSLGVAPDVPLVVVSGGGWGVGDLRGAVSAALRCEQIQVIVVCGENARAHKRLSAAFRREPRVRVVGYAKSMADLLGAANALIHSTGGLTCLEAGAQNCPVIAYGFGYGHLRENLLAMARHGMIRHARSSRELTQHLRDVLALAPAARREGAKPPSASSLVLDVVHRREGSGPLYRGSGSIAPAPSAGAVKLAVPWAG